MRHASGPYHTTTIPNTTPPITSDIQSWEAVSHGEIKDASRIVEGAQDVQLQSQRVNLIVDESPLALAEGASDEIKEGNQTEDIELEGAQDILSNDDDIRPSRRTYQFDNSAAKCL